MPKKKIITRTRQYLCGSVICLRLQSCRDFTIIKEKYKVRQYSFSLTQKLHLENLNHQNNGFYILPTGFTMGYKIGQKFFTRQDLRGSAICLRPQSYRDFTIIKEKYKVRQYSFSLTQKLHPENPNHQNNSFYILRIEFTMSYKKAKKFSQDNIYMV